MRRRLLSMAAAALPAATLGRAAMPTLGLAAGVALGLPPSARAMGQRPRPGAVAVPPGMPLPKLPDLVELRPVYLHNPRFARPDPALLAAVLAHALPLAKEHFGLALAFAPLRELPIQQAFASLDAAQLARLATTVYDFKRGTGDRTRLVRGTRRSLETGGSGLEAMLAYARPHLLQPPAAESFEGLAAAAVATQLERIAQWQRLRGADGQPLLDAAQYNEFNAWLAAAERGGWAWEVVLTNQLLASAEYDNNHLHSALRGGVSNGLTTQAPLARHGLVSAVSLFPFTSNDAGTVALRGGVVAAGDEPPRWAAALLVHELGHQLLHLNHPFGRSACIMNPPPLLRFREWLAGLDGKACPLGSTPEMKPGAVWFQEIRR